MHRCNSTCPCLQDTNDEKTKEAVKLANKKTPASKSKEKVVKPKKEIIKTAKPVKPDPTAKAKVASHQPGVVRGITYYKAAKIDEDERGGEWESVYSWEHLCICVWSTVGVENNPNNFLQQSNFTPWYHGLWSSGAIGFHIQNQSSLDGFGL